MLGWPGARPWQPKLSRHSLCLPAQRRVAIQEAERWNVLLSEMRRSLFELDLGLKGDLTMTEPMASLWPRALPLS